MTEAKIQAQSTHAASGAGSLGPGLPGPGAVSAPEAQPSTTERTPRVAARAGKESGAARSSEPLASKTLAKLRLLLVQERAVYLRQAEELAAEAEALASEREPGDVQFDEESGEGDPMNVERERDLTLSASARHSVEEIDRALARIVAGAYGLCERCHRPIPVARLEALPHAAFCVDCKSRQERRR